MSNVLLLYSTVYGLSRRICEKLQTLLIEQGEQVVVAPLVGHEVDPAGFDVIVIGASIRQGKHNPAVLAFIRQHLALLQSKPSAFFSVNLVARKPAKNTPQTNPYLKRFLAHCPWQPRLLGVFAGELDYQRYGPVDRHLVRFVMWLNKGPTDLSTRTTFTDWQEVERFAGQIRALAVDGKAAPATEAAAPACALS